MQQAKKTEMAPAVTSVQRIDTHNAETTDFPKPSGGLSVVVVLLGAVVHLIPFDSLDGLEQAQQHGLCTRDRAIPHVHAHDHSSQTSSSTLSTQRPTQASSRLTHKTRPTPPLFVDVRPRRKVSSKPQSRLRVHSLFFHSHFPRDPRAIKPFIWAPPANT